MMLFALALLIIGGYQAVYLCHSVRRTRICSAAGAGFGALLCLAAAALLVWYRG